MLSLAFGKHRALFCALAFSLSLSPASFAATNTQELLRQVERASSKEELRSLLHAALKDEDFLLHPKVSLPQVVQAMFRGFQMDSKVRQDFGAEIRGIYDLYLERNPEKSLDPRDFSILAQLETPEDFPKVVARYGSRTKLGYSEDFEVHAGLVEWILQSTKDPKVFFQGFGWIAAQASGASQSKVQGSLDFRQLDALLEPVPKEWQLEALRRLVYEARWDLGSHQGGAAISAGSSSALKWIERCFQELPYDSALYLSQDILSRCGLNAWEARRRDYDHSEETALEEGVLYPEIFYSDFLLELIDRVPSQAYLDLLAANHHRISLEGSAWAKDRMVTEIYQKARQKGADPKQLETLQALLESKPEAQPEPKIEAGGHEWVESYVAMELGVALNPEAAEGNFRVHYDGMKHPIFFDSYSVYEIQRYDGKAWRNVGVVRGYGKEVRKFSWSLGWKFKKLLNRS